MSLLLLIVILFCIGAAVAVVEKDVLIELPAFWKKLIRIVAIIGSIWLVLTAFGVIDYLLQAGSVQVPRLTERGR